MLDRNFPGMSDEQTQTISFPPYGKGAIACRSARAEGGSPEGTALWRGTGLARNPVGPRRMYWRLKSPGTVRRA